MPVVTDVGVVVRLLLAGDTWDPEFDSGSGNSTGVADLLERITSDQPESTSSWRTLIAPQLNPSFDESAVQRISVRVARLEPGRESASRRPRAVS